MPRSLTFAVDRALALAWQLPVDYCTFEGYTDLAFIFACGKLAQGFSPSCAFAMASAWQPAFDYCFFQDLQVCL